MKTEYNGSDHNSIEFLLEADIEREERKLSYKKANWSEFSKIQEQHNIRTPAEITERRLEKCLVVQNN